MHRIRSGFLTLAATASLLLGASIGVTPAIASGIPITFAFDGKVTFLDGAVGDKASLNELFHGTITYDSSKIVNPGGTGTSPLAITGLTVTYANSLYTAVFGNSADNYIHVANLPTSDTYIMHAPLNASILGATTAGGYSPLYFEVGFTRDPGLFVNVPPTLGSSFSNPTGRLVFNLPFGSQPVIAGELTKVTVVPLPPAVILFGAGLVALIGLGARNWQRTSGVRLEV